MAQPQTDRPARGYGDVITGIALACIGLIATVMAAGFDAQSRSYPFVLGLVLAGLGLALAGRGWVIGGQQIAMSSKSQLFMLIAGIVLIGLWIAAVTGGAGFLLPTFVMQIVFVWLCGARSLRTLLIAPVLITAASYLVFIQFLDVPIETLFAIWNEG